MEEKSVTPEMTEIAHVWIRIMVRSHLDKFSELYEKTLEPKKQRTKIDTFLHCLKLVKMGNFFQIYKAIEK